MYAIRSYYAVDKAGVDLDRPMFTSCGSGVTACVVSLPGVGKVKGKRLMEELGIGRKTGMECVLRL